MTIDEIRNAVKADSFQPFVLHTADGRALPVPHSKFILVVTGGRTVIVTSAVNDDFAIIGLPYLTRLEVPANGLTAPNPESTQKL